MIEVTAGEGHMDTLAAVAEQCGALDWHVGGMRDGNRRAIRILAAAADRQKILDGLQKALSGQTDWRLSIQPVDATLPLPDKDNEQSAETEEKERRRALAASREEIYAAIARGGSISSYYTLLAVLATLVAAIGLIGDNVAVIIGAMVVAPFLGPNLAFSLGAALGDGSLMLRAVITTIFGLAMAILLPAVASALWTLPLEAGEITSRTGAGLDSVALALASGIAAGLSVTRGLSSTLVGVMVAVALLPPAATLGLMLGAGRWAEAGGAALLLAINLVSVNLAALLVFVYSGIRPRGWLERQSAKQASRNSLIVSALLLLAMTALILLRNGS